MNETKIQYLSDSFLILDLKIFKLKTFTVSISIKLFLHFSLFLSQQLCEIWNLKFVMHFFHFVRLSCRVLFVQFSHHRQSYMIMNTNEKEAALKKKKILLIFHVIEKVSIPSNELRGARKENVIYFLFFSSR